MKKEPLIKTANMTDEEWAKLESLVVEYQEKNPDWERTGFETIEDMEKLIAGETLTTDREKAEKAFEKADIANAGKRAEELQIWVESYKFALRDLEFAKEHLKSIVDQAKDKGFSRGILDAVLVSKGLLGVEKIAFLDVVHSKTPETDNKCEDVGVCTCEE